ncbi:AMP-binding protein [Ferrovibrio sp.]|uniref:AMP-binding protein n=1 Tax=Ferrovibrio sp. TaxID=1917215 RepID=UPI003D0CA3C6
MTWAEKTFADALHWGARTYDRREALVHGDIRLSYADLARRADDLASGLLERGLQPGDKVALWLPDCLDWLVARWAITAMGCVLVPVNTRFRDADLGYVLKQSDARALILASRWKSVSYLAVLEKLVPDLSAQRPGAWDVAALPELRLVAGIGDDLPGSILPLQEVEEAGRRWSRGAELLRQARDRLRSDDIAQILFTSGTTSFPKGAMVRHGALLENNFSTVARMRLTTVDRYLVTSPLFSATGTSFTLSPFLAGGCQVLMDGFSAESFCSLVEQERVTMSFFVEPIVHDLRAFERLGSFNLSSLRTGTGAPLSRESFRWIVEDLGCAELTNVYGLSETSNAVCRTFSTEPLQHRIESSGPPMPGVSIRIDDIDTGAALPPGKVGEIRVKGFTVMAGYYRNPEETAKAIDADGWLHTGDLGELTPDGRLIFRGRIKEMIKPGGFNVATLEIEEFIKGLDGVKEAVVVGVPDERLGEAGFVYVECQPGVAVAAEDIIAHCRAHIASFKVPRHVAFISDWPVTPTGKLRKLSLKEDALRRVGGADA